MSLRVSVRYRPDRPNLFAAWEHLLPAVVASERRARAAVRRLTAAERMAAAEERKAMAAAKVAAARERLAAAERERAAAEGRRLAAAKERKAARALPREGRRAAATAIREALGERLDRFMMGPVREVCEDRYGVKDYQFLTLFNDVAEVLFPTDWDEGEADRAVHAELRREREKAGLVPGRGLDTYTTAAMEAYRDELEELDERGE